MSLCWGCQEQINNKIKFQYPLAGHLSTKLWYHLFPKVNVIFRLIICEENINQPFGEYNLSEYITKLNNTGAKVVTTKIKNCKDCDLKSRIARMLAYTLPEVNIIIFKKDFFVKYLFVCN